MSEHGLSSYWQGCRCDVCRAARKRYSRRHKALQRKAQAMGMPLTVPAVGPKRRIQALMAVGWNMAQLAKATGHHRRSLEAILSRDQKRTDWEFAGAIKMAYDELWDQEPPPGRSRTYLRNLAKKRGYLPPMAWDDDTIDDPEAVPYIEAEPVIDWQAIDRRIKGQNVKLTRAERQAACRAMAASGKSATQISRVMKIDGTQARRYVEEAA